MTSSLDSIKISLQQDSDKGPLLELVICDLLEDNGFSNIHRQQSGSQYGFDIVATKESVHDSKPEVWKFECKNLNSPISVSHIAPKLIWHLSTTIIDRFIIISVSPLGNELYHLLEQRMLPMAIEVWEGDTLFKKILQSPKALKRLGLSKIVKKETITIPVVTREFLPNEVTWTWYTV